MADFGVSQIHEASKSLTSPNEAHGYYPYMAKELLTGGRYNNKIDVWSTGCVLFEMANLKAMWYNAPEHHVRREAVMFKVYTNIEARNHEKFDEDCPQEIKEMVLKATSNDPNDRPTAQELYDQAKALQSRL